MLYLWIFGALAALAAGALLLMERKIRRRTLRVAAAVPDANPRAERVIELRLNHAGTGFLDQLPMPLRLQANGPAEVWLTQQALFVGVLAIPLADVREAVLAAGALRVRFVRGGERLETVLEGPGPELERLRREIHVRQPNVLQQLIDMVVEKNDQGHGPR
ncbi:MAG TPA: hypothetical protein VLW85_00605 [Myxococcales bacterium]|nr:hypothetical protein [Myxococcales bacterium]